jgi:hypothetical protein
MGINVNNMSVTELRQCINRAHCEMSFWGQRCVYFQNGASVPLYAVIERLFVLGEECLNTNYSMEERRAGHDIKKKLIQFYDHSIKPRYLISSIIAFILSPCKYVLDWDREKHYTFPESYEKLSYRERLSTYEYFQGFKEGKHSPRSGDHLASTFMLPVNGRDQRVEFYRLKEIGEFTIY